MIKEILESLKNTTNKKVTLKFKDIFEIADNINDLRKSYEIPDIYTDDEIKKSIETGLMNYFKNKVKIKKEFAIPTHISVFFNKVILDDWETLNNKGKGRASTEEEIEMSLNKLTDIEVDEIEYFNDNLFINLV